MDYSGTPRRSRFFLTVLLLLDYHTIRMLTFGLSCCFQESVNAMRMFMAMRSTPRAEYYTVEGRTINRSVSNVRSTSSKCMLSLLISYIARNDSIRITHKSQRSSYACLQVMYCYET